jgi:hypothetical protein
MGMLEITIVYNLKLYVILKCEINCMNINSPPKSHPRFILLKNRFINLQYVKSVVVDRTIHDNIAVSIYREGEEPLLCLDEDAIKIIDFLTNEAELIIKGKPQSWERTVR